MIHIYTCPCGTRLHTDTKAGSQLDQMICERCGQHWGAATSMPQCQLPVFGPESSAKNPTAGGRKVGGVVPGTPSTLVPIVQLTKQKKALKKIEKILTEGAPNA